MLGVSNKTGDSWHFRPNGKAPSNEGLLCFSDTPQSGRHQGWGTGDGGGVPTGPDGSPAPGPSGLLRERGT